MKSIATIRVKSLRLRTYIGFNEEEKTKKQDVILNLMVGYDSSQASTSDDVEDAYNYKTLTKEIIEFVENKRFNLLEKMAADILDIVAEDLKVLKAQVIIDKPHALRFSDSVSVELNFTR